MTKVKGIRIRRQFERIYFNLVLSSLTFLSLSIFLLEIKITEKIINQSISSNLNGLVFLLTISLITSLIMIALICIFVKKPIKYLSNLQKLAKVIKLNGFMVINDKKLTYYPKFYYFENDEKMTISIKLDGSRFHEKFLGLQTKFEHVYIAELTDKVIKDSYVIYTLCKIDNSRRLDITNVSTTDKYKIQLMKGLEYNIAENPHALICGATKGGKSSFLMYLIKKFLEMDCIVKIADPKMSDLSTLDEIMGEDNVVYTKGQILQQLRLANEEMDRRYLEIRNSKGSKFGKTFMDHGYKPYILIIDEFVAFMDSLETKKGNNEMEEAEEALTNVILKGRAAGVQVYLTTQRADTADGVKGSWRDQLFLRVFLGNSPSKAGLRMVFGDVDKEFSTRTEKGSGWIFIMGESSVIQEFYSPWVDKDYDFVEDIVHILQHKKDNEDNFIVLKDQYKAV